MAGEQTVSGHITWKQQAGSVLQQRKIFRSSPTTRRRSHFIWPGGCGHRIDTFPTVRAGYAVVHLSAAPSHIFFHFMSSLSLPWQTWHLSSSIHFPTFFPTSSSFPPSFLHFSRFLSCPSCLSSLFSNLTSSCFRRTFLPAPTFPFKRAHSCLCHPLSLSVCGRSHLI